MRRLLWALLALGALGGGCILDADGNFEEPPPVGNGGQGGEPADECSEASDCPGQDEPCRIRSCDNNICGVVVLSLNTSCGNNGEVCDGQGECVLPDGFDCSDARQCLSGHCWDEVCCNESCGGVCESCDDMRGTCTKHAAATDPEMGCNGGVCDGAGECAVGNTADSTRFGAAFNDAAVAVAASPDGNMVVGAEFESALAFGGNFTATVRDGLVLKLDTALNPTWARQIGGVGIEHISAVGTDSAGNVYAAGHYDLSLSVGTDNYTTTGSNDIFVAKWDATGNFQWSKSFGSIGSEQALDLAVAPNGTVTVVGWIGGSVSFDGGNTTLTPVSLDAFAVTLDGAGNHLASNSWGSSSADSATAVAVDDDGEVWIAGSMAASMSLGGPTLVYSGPSVDGWVAKLGADLSHSWSFAVNATGAVVMERIALRPDGSGVLGLDWDGQIDLQGNVRSSFDSSSDIALARLSDADGSASGVDFYVGQGEQRADGVVSDSRGNVIMFGTSQGNIDFGGGALTSPGNSDVFVVKFSGDGTHLFSRLFGDSSSDEAQDVAITTDGRIVGVGVFEGSINFGVGNHTTAGTLDQDAFVVSFEP